MPPAAALECERMGWTLDRIATVAPASAAARAARWPARPAPMIRTSCSGMRAAILLDRPAAPASAQARGARELVQPVRRAGQPAESRARRCALAQEAHPAHGHAAGAGLRDPQAEARAPHPLAPLLLARRGHTDLVGGGAGDPRPA